MSPFAKQVTRIVKLVPKGKVVSYGQVALILGMPRAAREVGWALNSLEEEVEEIDLPWWRVINNKGLISIKGTKWHDKSLQKKLLQAEGIDVSNDLIVDMSKYRFLPDQKFIEKLELDGKIVQQLVEKYNL